MNDFISLKIKRSDRFVYKEVGEEGILVEISNNVVNMDKVYTLNELGAFVYRCIETPKSINEIVDHIVSEFEVNPDNALTDLEVFIHDALDKEIVSVI